MSKIKKKQLDFSYKYHTFHSGTGYGLLVLDLKPFASCSKRSTSSVYEYIFCSILFVCRYSIRHTRTYFFILMSGNANETQNLRWTSVLLDQFRSCLLHYAKRGRKFAIMCWAKRGRQSMVQATGTFSTLHLLWKFGQILCVKAIYCGEYNASEKLGAFSLSIKSK